MNALRDLITNTSYFSEHAFVDVHYYIRGKKRMETVALGADIHERIGRSHVEFVSPKGVHLYGLLRNPSDGRLYAFLSAEERDRVKAKWSSGPARVAKPLSTARLERRQEEDPFADEWRVDYSPRRSRRPFTFSLEDDFQPVIVYYSGFETNRRRH